MSYIYVAGDIMSQGSQYELKQIEDLLDQAGLEYYSPRKNASINDKKKQTVESNNGLAERIVKADTERLEQADIIVFNLKQHAIGTMCEVGQVYGMVRAGAKKKCYFLYDDIRRTDLPEVADRRSWSINQYLYGLVLALSDGAGFLTLEQLAEELKKL